MGRPAASCRWCGADLASTGPRVWCSTACRDTYVRRLGSPQYSGSVALIEVCHGVCRLDGTTTTFAGPLSWPGAHASAARVVAILTHGHTVDVVVAPVDLGGHVHTADDGAFKMPTRARMAVVG